MDELKLLEKMLRQRDKGELPDYQGTDVEEQQVASCDRLTQNGLVQAWLDEFRWKKNEELIGLIGDPAGSSSLAYMTQQCAMQVLLEREGEAFVKKLLSQRREEAKKQEEWQRKHDGEDGQEGFSAGAGREQERRGQPQKDAKGVGGVRKAGQGREEGQARAGDLQAVRQGPVVHSVQTSGAWGHMETSIVDRAAAVESNGRFRINLQNLDLHTQIFIKSRQDPTWSNIEDFEDHYGKPHDTSFATYEGVLLHENQHVEERIAVFNRHLPAFREQVKAIEASTKEEALERYEELYEKFERAVDAEYWAIGEAPARALEWEYYHEAYEQETGARGASRSSARAAGAAQGREESKAQQREMMMNALAGERRVERVQDDEEDLAEPEHAPDARRPRLVLVRSPELDAAALPGEGSAEVADAPAPPVKPAERPRLVALLSQRGLDPDPTREGLRFAGTRPVFGIGEQTRVMGAKAGVTLVRSPGWLESQRGLSTLPSSVEASGMAVDWLLRWWGEGAEEDRASGKRGPGKR